MLPNKLVQDTKRAQHKLVSTAVRSARQLLPDLSKLSQAGAGGVVRKVSVATVDVFGKAATQLAGEAYTDYRTAAKLDAIKLPKDRFDPEAIVDPFIGATMAKYQQGLFGEAQATFLGSLDKAVSDVFREQMVRFSRDDSQATGYQRVPSPNCCAFCAVVALNEYTSFDESGGYHNHCGCTCVPIFRDLGAFRPSYYDDLETDYTNATLAVDNPKTAEKIFAEIRRSTGRR